MNVIRIWSGFGLVLLMFPSLRAQHIRYDVPNSIKAGEKAILTLHIPRMGLGGMARFQMDFPLEVTINERSSSGALFSFGKQTLDLLWIDLPQNDTLVVAVEFMGKVGYGGQIEVPARMFYLDQSQRKVFGYNSLKLNVAGESVRRYTPVKRETITLSKAPETSSTKQKHVQAEAPAPNDNAKNKEGEGLAAYEEAELTVARPDYKAVKGLRFRIQIASTSTPANIDELAKSLVIEKKSIREYKINESYKYTSGDFENLATARDFLNANELLKSKGFVVAFLNEERIELEEAIKLSRKK
jgi:hypothetical protein